MRFYRDVLGLQLKLESPESSESATGETTLALHPATARHSPGEVELGFTVADIQKFHQDLSSKAFTMPKQDFGGVLAQLVDSEGCSCSVGGQ